MGVRGVWSKARETKSSNSVHRFKPKGGCDVVKPMGSSRHSRRTEGQSEGINCRGNFHKDERVWPSEDAQKDRP